MSKVSQTTKGTKVTLKLAPDQGRCDAHWNIGIYTTFNDHDTVQRTIFECILSNVLAKTSKMTFLLCFRGPFAENLILYSSDLLGNAAEASDDDFPESESFFISEAPPALQFPFQFAMPYPAQLPVSGPSVIQQRGSVPVAGPSCNQQEVSSGHEPSEKALGKRKRVPSVELVGELHNVEDLEKINSELLARIDNLQDDYEREIEYTQTLRCRIEDAEKKMDNLTWSLFVAKEKLAEPPRRVNNENGVCPICMGNLDSQAAKTGVFKRCRGCAIVCCHTCFETWTKQQVDDVRPKCSVCRTAFCDDFEDLVALNNQFESQD
ncbi:hypothetical protein HDU79_006769 [Rhizoclosmatium sp. JEL0117]|nr:hypothetical protein HDU79_006769 [Rhizoclosmatium sp. JEL0117]